MVKTTKARVVFPGFFMNYIALHQTAGFRF